MSKAYQYEIGKWTRATLKILEDVARAEVEGKRLKSTDFKSGAKLSWLYLLHRSGYLEQPGRGEGYFLTQEGRDLLEKLRKNPPQARKGADRPNNRKNNTPQDNSKPSDEQLYNVVIEHPRFGTKAKLTEQQLKELSMALTNIMFKS